MKTEIMKKFEYLPPYVQKLIDEKERLLNGRALHKREKQATGRLDAMYSGKSTDQSNNYDRKEINSYMSLGEG